MTDTETLKVYAQKAKDYAELTTQNEIDDELAAFMKALPPQGDVLDLGCGPGQAAGHMARAGYGVTAMDPVPEMVAMADMNEGVTAQVGTFDDIKGYNTYDGIWANFCLLHAPRADVPRHLTAIAHALRPGGIFHIGVKLGTGEKRDPIGRLYTYFTEPELEGLLNEVGLTITDRTFGSGIGLDGAMADWICLRAHG